MDRCGTVNIVARVRTNVVKYSPHLGHMDRVAATMPSQAHAGAAQEAPDIGQWEGQDVPLVRPSSCNVKGGIPSSRRYLPTYLTTSYHKMKNTHDDTPYTVIHFQ